MAAILGLSPSDVAEVCKKAAENDVVSPANLNSPEQTVISGNAAAVKRAVEIASQSGAKRAVMLPVSAPFHCDLMAPAQERLEKDLRATKFYELRFPVVTNADAEAITIRRRSTRSLGPPSYAARALARFRARNDGKRRDAYSSKWVRARCCRGCCGRLIAPSAA